MEERGATDMQEVLKKWLGTSLQLSESNSEVQRQPKEHWSHPPFFSISLARYVKSHTQSWLGKPGRNHHHCEGGEALA